MQLDHVKIKGNEVFEDEKPNSDRQQLVYVPDELLPKRAVNPIRVDAYVQPKCEKECPKKRKKRSDSSSSYESQHDYRFKVEGETKIVIIKKPSLKSIIKI